MAAKGLVLVTIVLSLLSLASCISYVNITADNTFELFVDGVGLVTPLCLDNSTYRSKYEAPNNGSGLASNCFWGEPTRIPAIELSAGSVVAIHGRNALGNNTNPLLGGTNPGAFILTVTGQNNDICASTDTTSKWTCADNLQLLQYTGSPYPPANWNTANYQPPSWWSGPLDDLGVNNVDAWRYLTTQDKARTWPNSIWYNTIPLGPMPVPGVDVKAHWVWYRYNVPNTDVYCRLKIASSFNCSVKSSSPSPTISFSSSITPSPSRTPSVSGSPSISITPSRTSTVSVTPSRSGTSAASQSSSVTPTSSQSSSVTPTSSRSVSSSSTPTSSSSNTPSATSSSSTTPSPSPSPSCPPCYFWSSDLRSCRPINESLDFDPSNNTCAEIAIIAGDGGGGNNAGAIAGGVVGGVVGIAAIGSLVAAGVVAAFILKKRAVASTAIGSAFSGSSGAGVADNPTYAPSANAPQDNPLYAMGS